MKRLGNIIQTISAAFILAALPSIGFTSCESFDDTEILEAIKDLQQRVSVLEKQVAENVSALQSMVSLGKIADCEYDTETGKVTIILLDGKTFTFDMGVTGNPLVTIVEKDNEYWWGICIDGKTELLEIDGKNIPVSVTPDLKISDNNEWLISVDGGKTWVNTGVFLNGNSDENGVVFFKEVRQEGDYLYLTLADGQEIKVAIVGEAEFSVSETSLWFTRESQEKALILTMKNVKAFTVTEKPEGWKTQVSEEMLLITSPSDIGSSEKSGTIKMLSTFSNGANPEIISIDVNYEDELTLTADTYGTVKVTVSEHASDSYSGYLIKAWKESEFSAEAATEWLNTKGYTANPQTATAEFTVSGLVEDYDEAASYVIFVAPYIPIRLITSGEDSYTSEELLTATYSPSGTKITVSDIMYDSAHINATFTDLEGYFGGISTTEDWNNFVMDNFLEQLSYGGLNPLTATSYDGTASKFPDGVNGITIMPDTEYTLWLLPVNESNEYSEEDFVLKTFTTAGISADNSITAPTHIVTEVTFGGFTAEVTPAAGAYKTYATILPAASIPQSDEEIVKSLIKANRYSKGEDKLTVSTNSYNSDTEVYIISVSMSKDGGYGAIVKEKVALKELEFSDAVGISACEATCGVGDVTLTLSFIGEPATITYSVASFTFYEDEVLEKMMAMSQYGDEQDKEVSKLTNGNQIYLTGLEIGAEYTLYAIVKDVEGNPSRLFKKTFVPSISVDYVLSTDENYEYGMPQISGGWPTNTSYELYVDMPDTCTKYWISVCDSEYLTGDVWSDTDKLITETLYNSEAHTAPIEGKLYTYLNKASRIFMAWLDDKGNYHAIYEYNIQNDK